MHFGQMNLAASANSNWLPDKSTAQPSHYTCILNEVLEPILHNFHLAVDGDLEVSKQPVVWYWNRSRLVSCIKESKLLKLLESSFLV